MKQLINKFLKEQGYAKGQIYKVCPDILLNKFYHIYYSLSIFLNLLFF